LWRWVRIGIGIGLGVGLGVGDDVGDGVGVGVRVGVSDEVGLGSCSKSGSGSAMVSAAVLALRSGSGFDVGSATGCFNHIEWAAGW